jgi:hypothetical protein
MPELTGLLKLKITDANNREIIFLQKCSISVLAFFFKTLVFNISFFEACAYRLAVQYYSRNISLASIQIYFLNFLTK